MSWPGQAAAVFRREFLTDFRYGLVFLITLADAGLLLLSYAFLARVFGGTRPDGFAPLPFLLVGIALTDSLTTALVCVSKGVRQNQQTGTLKAMLVLPISPARLMLLSLPYPVLRASLDFVLFMAAALVLGLPAAPINWPASFIVFMLSVTAIAGLGLLSAAFVVVFKRGDPVQWALGTMTWLLSGVLYPVGVLPPVLARAASWLPTTHALTAMRSTAIGGAGLSDVATDVRALGAFAAVALPAGLWMFTLAVNRARRTGTLGHA